MNEDMGTDEVVIGEKPLYRLALEGSQTERHSIGTKQRLIDPIRILAQAQGGVSKSDFSAFCSYYNGPPEGIDVMLALAAQDFLSANASVDVVPQLAVALREYASGLKLWEAMIRRLLRAGVNLNAAVPLRHFGVYWFDDWRLNNKHSSSISATPLDELFVHTNTPFEGIEAGKDWLGIFASQGYDTRAYLEEESVLHAEQQQLLILPQLEGTHILQGFFCSTSTILQAFHGTGALTRMALLHWSGRFSDT